MANEPDYTCTGCGATPGRDGLSVKKVIFTEMGAGGRVLRSRVVDWLCDNCLKTDPHWNQPKFQPVKDRLDNA